MSKAMDYLVKALYYSFDDLALRIEYFKLTMILYIKKGKEDDIKDILPKVNKIAGDFFKHLNKLVNKKG